MSRRRIADRSPRLSTRNTELVTKNRSRKFKIRWFKWANNERLLVGIAFASRRDSTPTLETRLLGINRDRSNAMELVRPKLIQGDDWNAQFQDDVIDILPDDREHVLISVDLEEPTYPTVYKLNIYTGKKRTVRRHRKPIRNWMTDSQGQVRVGTGFENTKAYVILSKAKGKRWA